MKIYRDDGGASRFKEFLTEYFCTSDFKIFPLAGDASDRRYYRVVHDDRSTVLMDWKPFENAASFPFLEVQALFAEAGVHVPRVLKIGPDLGLILLEDLGDLTLERKFWENQDQRLILPFYRLSLDELIKIHFRTLETGKTCSAFKVEFDVAKLLWEMNFCRKHLIEDLCAIHLTPAESRSLDQIFQKICEHLASQPKVLCHRDYHSRNIMLRLDEVKVIDFQDARMGSMQYDLVSLLRDSYVQLSPESQTELLDYYLKEREKAGQPRISRDEFFETFEIQTIQRCFKACGSFASFLNLRSDRRYLKYVQPTLHQVQRSLALFPQFQNFNEILDGYGLLDRNFDQDA